MTNNIITETDCVLASMLTENTGRAMMDSGDAYGRNWERNQGQTVESFIEAPAVQVSQWGISLDLFHYLRERIEFAPDVQEVFDEWSELPENKETNWYALMEEWCERYEDSFYKGGFNSYNSDCLLSQTIQGNYFEWQGETYLILQIHGGCDVRGGYTAPKIFREHNDPGSVTYYWNSYIVQSANDRKGEAVSLEFNHGDVCNLKTGEYIGDGYRFNKKENDDPLLDWFDTLEWDEDTESFIAPDGDGHVEFVALDAC